MRCIFLTFPIPPNADYLKKKKFFYIKNVLAKGKKVKYKKYPDYSPDKTYFEL